MLRYIVLILIVAGCGGECPPGDCPCPDSGVDAGDQEDGGILGGDLVGTSCIQGQPGNYCGTIDGRMENPSDYYWICHDYADPGVFIWDVVDCRAHCENLGMFYRGCGMSGCLCY